MRRNFTSVLYPLSWALPGSFTSKSSTFCSDKLLVGGNGTAYDSSKTSGDYAIIDTADAPGYLTGELQQLATDLLGVVALELGHVDVQ